MLLPKQARAVADLQCISTRPLTRVQRRPPRRQQRLASPVCLHRRCALPRNGDQRGGCAQRAQECVREHHGACGARVAWRQLQSAETGVCGRLHRGQIHADCSVERTSCRGWPCGGLRGALQCLRTACSRSQRACTLLGSGAPQLPRHAVWAYVCKSPRALVRMYLAKPLKSTQKRRLGSVCHAGRVDHCPPRLTPPLASIPRGRRIRRGCLVASNQCRMQASTWRCGPRRCLEGGTLDQATRRARCLAGPAAAGGTCTHRRAGMPLCSADARLWACVYIFLAATT